MMPNHGFSPDLSFFHEEIKLGCRAYGRGNWGGEKQASHTEITSPRNIMPSFTAPKDPHVVHGLDARNHSS
jgi:hypothetical protein